MLPSDEFDAAYTEKMEKRYQELKAFAEAKDLSANERKELLALVSKRAAWGRREYARFLKRDQARLDKLEQEAAERNKPTTPEVENTPSPNEEAPQQSDNDLGAVKGVAEAAKQLSTETAPTETTPPTVTQAEDASNKPPITSPTVDEELPKVSSAARVLNKELETSEAPTVAKAVSTPIQAKAVEEVDNRIINKTKQNWGDTVAAKVLQNRQASVTPPNTPPTSPPPATTSPPGNLGGGGGGVGSAVSGAPSGPWSLEATTRPLLTDISQSLKALTGLGGGRGTSMGPGTVNWNPRAHDGMGRRWARGDHAPSIMETLGSSVISPGAGAGSGANLANFMGAISGPARRLGRQLAGVGKGLWGALPQNTRDRIGQMAAPITSRVSNAASSISNKFGRFTSSNSKTASVFRWMTGTSKTNKSPLDYRHHQEHKAAIAAGTTPPMPKGSNAGGMLGGAASGASMGMAAGPYGAAAGAVVGAATAAPDTAAVAATLGGLAAAAYEAGKAIYAFARAQEGEVRRLSEFGGAQAMGIAQLDANRVLRDVKTAEGTGSSSIALTESINKFETALQPIEELLTNIANTIGSDLLDMVTEVLEDMKPMIEAAQAAYEWFKGESINKQIPETMWNRIDSAEDQNHISNLPKWPGGVSSNLPKFPNM